MVKRKKSVSLHKQLHQEFDPKVKRMDVHDVQLTKLSVAAFVLFLITVWPALLVQILRVHWGWYLAIGIVLAIRPMTKVFGCKNCR